MLRQVGGSVISSGPHRVRLTHEHYYSVEETGSIHTIELLDDGMVYMMLADEPCSNPKEAYVMTMNRNANMGRVMGVFARAIALTMLEYGYARIVAFEPISTMMNDTALAICRLAEHKYRRLRTNVLAFKECARRYRAAHTIADAWKRVYKSPYYVIGRRQVMRDYEELVADCAGRLR